MALSDASVLWSLFLVPLPEVGQVHIIGVDDWSWRRGKRFGSILVNLETHKIVDLLADREAESVKRWLAAHPEVDVVSRDRGGCYIEGGFRRGFAGFSRKFCSDDAHKGTSTHRRYSR